MSKTSPFKVGIFSILMVVVITSLLIWKSGILIKATGYNLIGEFEHVNGLLNGAAVSYRGYKVGTVSKVIPGPKSIKVTYFEIEYAFL